MTQGNDPQKQPRNLDYAPSPPKGAPIGTAIGAAILGCLSTLGALALAFVLESKTSVPVLVGAPVILAALFGVQLLVRSASSKSLPIEEFKRVRRFYVIGFLIGCGIGGLLEGLCFAAVSKI